MVGSLDKKSGLLGSSTWSAIGNVTCGKLLQLQDLFLWIITLMWAWLDSGVNIFSYLNFCYKVTTEHLFCAKHPAEGLMGPIPTPVYEEFSLYHQAIIQYQLGVLQFNSIQTLHTGDSLRFHKNSPLQMPFPSPGYHLYF